MDIKVIRRKIRKHRYTIKKVAGLVAAVLAIAIVFNFLTKCSDDNASQSNFINGVQTIEYDGKTYKFRDDVEAILAIGIDKYAKDAEPDEDTNLTNQQSDFLILLVIDKTNKSYNLLHINRDTMTNIQEIGLNSEVIGTNYEQICLAHTYGTGGKDSCRNTVTAVSQLLYGIPISHYVSFTMDVVPIVNDAAGGVTVHINDDFSANEPAFVQGTDVTLKGEQALTFVRARSGMVNDSTNLNRMERQRAYVTALRSAVDEKMKSDSKWAANTLLDVMDYLTTDLTDSDLGKLANAMVDYKQSDILQTQGEAKTNEYVEFYPDEEALKKQVIDLFFTPVEG